MKDRFFKEMRVGEKDIDLKNTVMKLDNGLWKVPLTISLERLGKELKVNIEEDISERNVSSIEENKNEKQPFIPPVTNPVQKTYITIDENYLYVWIPSQKRWKRALLSEW
jgi:hypothetical protein